MVVRLGRLGRPVLLAALLIVNLVSAPEPSLAQNGVQTPSDDGFLPPPANSPLPLPEAPDRSVPPAGLTLTVPDGEGVDTDLSAGSVFRVGFLAGAAPALARDRLTPFTDHMQAVLQRPVDLVPFQEARGLMGAMERGTIGYAMGPASLVSAMDLRCACIEPLASQANGDGGFGLFSALVVPQDGLVGAIADLAEQERRLVVVGQGSVVAHHVGLSELWRAGVALRGEQISFASSFAEAARQMAAGEADAVLMWTRQVEGGVLFDVPPVHELSDEERGALRIIWRSRPLAGHTHLVHTGVSEEERGTLKQMLTGLHGRDGEAFDAIDQGSGRAFVAVDLETYQPYRDALGFWQDAAAAPLR
ncbi:MAG: PhnD/SsuA/transferrin family substrate-binding protein [Pseudomonadota bacterium]